MDGVKKVKRKFKRSRDSANGDPRKLAPMLATLTPIRARADGIADDASARWALAAGLTVLVAASVFAGGGSTTRSLVWIGGGAIALATGAGAAIFAGLVGRPSIGAAGWATLVLLAAFVAWNGITIAWSVAPDRSWEYFNRGLAHLAFLVLGLVVAALVPRSVTWAARALGAIVAVALAWALAGKFIPALYEDGGRIARLRAPVEYWNALALLFALALPLALLLTASPRRPALRALGAVYLYALVVGLLLTYSRGGVAVSVAVVAAWLALGGARLPSIVALALAVPLALALAVWAFGQPGLSADGADYETRVADGAQFAGLFALGAALVVAVSYSLARAARWAGDDAFRIAIPRRTLVAVTGVAAIGAAAILFVAADPVAWARAQADEFSNPPTAGLTQEPGRLTSVSSNNRWIWWQEAWEAFRAEPVRGTGAGTFALTHRLLRENELYVLEPHNEALQFLSETGIVGAVLAGGAATAALLGAASAVRRRRGTERGAAAALALGVGAYVLHSFVDWDWDFLAVSAPVFALAGILLGADGPRLGADEPRPAARRRSVLPLAASVALLFAAVASIVAPWLAGRRVDQAYAAIADDPARAARIADEAAKLNPLSIHPWLARSDAEVVLGDISDARRALVRAVETQPLNPEAWHAFSLFEYRVAGRPDVALRYARRAAELDRFGPAPPLVAELEALEERG